MKKLKAINNNLFQFVEEEKEQPTCKLFVKFMNEYQELGYKTYFFNDVKQAKKAFKSLLANRKTYVLDLWLFEELEEYSNFYEYVNSVFPQKSNYIYFKREKNNKTIKSHLFFL